MMDRICDAVLDRINSLSPFGRYVIIAEDEFFEAFPDGSNKSYDELDKALTSLKKNGYIDLKYSRGDMYCVAPLKQTEETPLPEPEKSKSKTDVVFLSAFAGSALGSLIVSLIFALL